MAKAKVAEDFHYKYGGSTASRTINCPGWVALTKSLNLKGGGSSSFADRGTMLHKACEALVIDKSLKPVDLLDMNIHHGEWTLDRELLEAKVIPAMDELAAFSEFYGVPYKLLQAEALLEISSLVGGTIDISADTPDVILILDFKFGEGIMVYARENSQLFFYAWLKIVDILKKKHVSRNVKVVVAIDQPADRRDEYLDAWETTVGAVLDFGGRFLKAVDIAEKTKAGENLCAGSHCQFCPSSGSGGCPEKTKAGNGALALIDTNALKKLDAMKIISDKGAINTLNLKQALILAAELEPWIKQVRSFAFKQLELGAKDIGYKLVQKRASKSWTDVEEVTKYLKRKLKAKNAGTFTVLSPAQAKKMAKKLDIVVDLESRITCISSGATLVPEDDKRDALLSDKAKTDSLKQLEALGKLNKTEK